MVDNELVRRGLCYQISATIIFTLFTWWWFAYILRQENALSDTLSLRIPTVILAFAYYYLFHDVIWPRLNWGSKNYKSKN